MFDLVLFRAALFLAYCARNGNKQYRSDEDKIVFDAALSLGQFARDVN